MDAAGSMTRTGAVDEGGVRAAPTSPPVLDGWDRGISGTALGTDRLVHVEFVWGTAVTLELVGVAGREADAHRAVAAACAWFTEVDGRFSTFKPLSEVSAFRNGLAHPAGPSADFAEVMLACRAARRRTRGAFDPWLVRGGYDPSGYVKGWAAGRASAILTAAGFDDHMVNAGGDVTCRGDRRQGSGRGWSIGIVDPHRPARVVRVVAIHDASIATSGRYERGDHVIDPRTGRPARGADSATVVGPDAGMADALASAALVDGRSSLAWFADHGPGWSLHLVAGGEELAWGPAFRAAAAAHVDSVPAPAPDTLRA